MFQILEEGQVIYTVPTDEADTSEECTIEKFIGGGGQGEVYQARFNGKDVAVKWYFENSATSTQRQGLEKLIEIGPPTARFLWPMYLVEANGVPGFGYIMPLRDARYKSITHLMKRKIEPSFKALATAGLQLADSYSQLHARGLCYRDISFGNVFFHPETGDVLICDNDNVGIDGEDTGGVLGTPRFMAPEVVRGESKPSTQTDLFSLAVLLFYMLIMHHPLEGKKEAEIKCLDLPAMQMLYGTDPLFIFDPNDRSNAPLKSYHDNALAFWPLYPKFIQKIFTDAFTKGLNDAGNGRVRESQWKKSMLRLRDSIIYCSCGKESIYDEEKMRENGGILGNCWCCGKPLQVPPRIRIDGHIIMLNHDTKLYQCHINDQATYDFTQPIGSINQHPSDPNRWGLKNLTAGIWQVTTAAGNIVMVEPQKSVPLVTGTRIDFGNTIGEIRA